MLLHRLERQCPVGSGQKGKVHMMKRRLIAQAEAHPHSPQSLRLRNIVNVAPGHRRWEAARREPEAVKPQNRAPLPGPAQQRCCAPEQHAAAKAQDQAGEIAHAGKCQTQAQANQGRQCGSQVMDAAMRNRKTPGGLVWFKGLSARLGE
jgi:hypothetical protein